MKNTAETGTLEIKNITQIADYFEESPDNTVQDIFVPLAGKRRFKSLTVESYDSKQDSCKVSGPRTLLERYLRALEEELYAGGPSLEDEDYLDYTITYGNS
jgi:hypothetical protein